MIRIMKSFRFEESPGALRASSPSQTHMLLLLRQVELQLTSWDLSVTNLVASTVLLSPGTSSRSLMEEDNSLFV